MSEPAPAALPRQSSFTRSSSFASQPVDARTACMTYNCALRGSVADALRANGETWSGTSWERRLELLQQAAPPLFVKNSDRRASAIGKLALGISTLVEERPGSKMALLKKFRLSAKRALWTQRKDALAQRSSFWWSIESHQRVQRIRGIFEDLNRSRKEYEHLPPLEYESFLARLFASIPIQEVFPQPQSSRSLAEEAPLDISNSPADASRSPHFFLILPNSSFRIGWDIITLFLLLYCAFSVPAQMSFSSDIPAHFIPPGQEESLDSSAASQTSVADYVDLAVDVVFMVDVLFNFRTAFFREHKTRSMVLETRSRVIALRYVKTSFLPDVMSSLPYQWISPIINEVAGFSKVPRLFKLMRLLRLIKLVRLTRISRTATNFKAYVGMTRAVSRAASFILIFSWVIHIIACVLYFCGTLNFRDPNGYLRSWLAESDVLLMGGNHSRVMDAPAGTRYAYSLYWAIAIVETIGYGDILPSQPSTVFALLLVMLVGVFVFSYLMGNVTSIVNLFDGLEARSSAAREEMQRFNFKQKIPHHLTERLEKWFMLEHSATSLSSRTATSAFDELPDFIKPAIALRSNMTHLTENELFREACDVMRPDAAPEAVELHRILTEQLSMLLKYTVFGCGDELLLESKPITSVLFVITGRICVFQPGCSRCCKMMAQRAEAGAAGIAPTHTPCNCSPVFSAGPGFMLGESALLRSSHRSNSTFKAVGRVVCHELHRKDWLELLETVSQFPPDFMHRLSDLIRRRQENIEYGIKISKQLLRLKARSSEVSPSIAASALHPTVQLPSSPAASTFGETNSPTTPPLPPAPLSVPSPVQLPLPSASMAADSGTLIASLMRLQSEQNLAHGSDRTAAEASNTHERMLTVLHSLCELRDKLQSQIQNHHGVYEDVTDCIFGLQALELEIENQD